MNTAEIRKVNSTIIPNKDVFSLPSDHSFNPQGAYDQINQFFSKENQQQKTVQEARDILGESAASLTDEEVYDLANEMQYLVDTWLEEFEKNIFDGKTLKDLLQLDL